MSILLEKYKNHIIDIIKNIHKNRIIGYNGIELQIEFFTNLQNYDEICNIFDLEDEDINEFFKKSLEDTGLYFSSNGILMPINKENINISFIEYKNILSEICKIIYFQINNDCNPDKIVNLIKKSLIESKYNNISISDITFSFHKNNKSIGEFINNELDKIKKEE